MTILVNASGPILFKIAIDSGLTTLQNLGYALDQPRVIEQPYWYDVHGDQHGGMNGPPIDVQYLGMVIRVRAELSRFDRDVANIVRKRIRNGTIGSVPDADIGALAFQSPEFMRVVMSPQHAVRGSASETRNYVCCIPREATEQSYGTKFSTFIFEFEAHRYQASSGLVENSTS